MRLGSKLPLVVAFVAAGCASTELPPDKAIATCNTGDEAPELLLGRTTPDYMLHEGLTIDRKPEVECPPLTKESGGRCFSTIVECPQGSRRAREDAKCIADVACPPGTDWSGFTCEPIKDETASTVLPPERLSKPPPPGSACTLHVNSIPVSNTVIDGRPLGKTPSTVKVSPGTHTVTFIHEDRGRKSVSIQCPAGQTKTAAVKFN